MISTRFQRLIEQRFALAVTLLLLFAAVLAVALRFVQDDAFISYRYADNLVRGYGLVWEPGVAVQGYTNLLWTLLIAGGMALGFGPVLISHALSISFYLVTILLTINITRRMTGSHVISIGAAAFLIVNFTFVSYATGGLETMMQTMLVTAAIWQTQHIVQKSDYSPGRMLALSMTFACAGLTRLDSAIFIAGLSVLLLIMAWKRPLEPKHAIRAFAILAIPGIIALLGYLFFSLSVYGEPLPNTFYAKTGTVSGSVLERGFRFVMLFVSQYGFMLPVALVLVQLKTVLRNPIASGILAIIFLWILYILVTGGDFMEFRFIVPVLPAVTTLVALAWSSFVADMPRVPSLRIALVSFVALISMSVYHSRSFGYVQGVEGISTLRYNLYGPNKDLVGIGKKLRGIFPNGYEGEPYVAVTAAGAIPFHSKLRSLDMLGLNDEWVARNGATVSDRPGHRRMATLEYLLSKDVNLIVSYPVRKFANNGQSPVFCPSDFRLSWDRERPAELEALVASPVILMPVNEKFDLAMIYLNRHPSVDRALSSGRLHEAQSSLLSGCQERRVLTTSTSG